MREKLVYLLIVLGCVVCQDDNPESQTYFPDTKKSLNEEIIAEEFKLEEGEVNKHEEVVIIDTGSGKIKGKKIRDDAKQYNKFLGIPFAEPPVGELRFKPPVPTKPWSDVLEAFSNGPACVQMITPALLGTKGTKGVSEDCLRLNIFTKSLDGSQAVMVWIHGGGYSSGSKDRYEMLDMVDRDIVLVTLNYRLGALGFLSFGNNLVSGNMGLKDQHLAIQWVEANIRNFGGDPNRITVFGESAGGASVHAHVLSPRSSGLLAGGIAQSGSALMLSVHPEDTGAEVARRAAQALGCPRSLDQEALACLQALNSSDLILSEPLPLQPVLDSFSSDPFLPMDPLEAMKTGMFNQIPFISGTVTYEGMLATGIEGLATLDLIENPPQEIAEFYGNWGPNIFFKVATQFYNHTTGESRVEQETPSMNFYTDMMFLSQEQKSLELMSRHTDSLYNYHMTQQTNSSIIGGWFGLGPEFTPMHGDDLVFLLTAGEEPDNFSEEERKTSEHMINYWINFAKYGNPNNENSPRWTTVNGLEKV